MDLNSGIKTLDIGRPTSKRLVELQKICLRAADSTNSLTQIIRVLMAWLHEQIINDKIMNDKTLLPGFVKVVSQYTANKDQSSFRKRSSSREEIDVIFDEWLSLDAADSATNRRRYLIAQKEIRTLFEQKEIGYEDDGLPRDLRQNREIGFQKSLDNSRDTQPIHIHKASGGRQRTGANKMPLGKPRNTTGKKQEIIEIMDDDNSPDARLFPHGLNDIRPPSSTDPGEVRVTRESIFLERSPEHGLSQSACQQAPRPKNDTYTRYPPANYICKRCDKPGHWLKCCPTNLDPRMDKTPDAEYQCQVCKRYGHHLTTLCPKNRNPDSLTVQRKATKTSQDTPEPIKQTRRSRRDRRSRSPSPCQWRQRSRSPFHRGRETFTDSYRPSGGKRGDRRGHRQRESSQPNSPPRGLKNRRSSPPPETATSHESRGEEHGLKSEFRRARKHQGRQVEVQQDEGRLAYDDEIIMETENPPASDSEKFAPDERLTQDMEDDALMAGTVPAQLIGEELQYATDYFLSELKLNDVPSRTERPSGLDPPGSMKETEQGLTEPALLDEMATESSSQSTTEKPDDDRFEWHDGIPHQIVAGPRFTAEVMSLFPSGKCVVVWMPQARLTAKDMWKQAESGATSTP